MMDVNGCMALDGLDWGDEMGWTDEMDEMGWMKWKVLG